jgi:hypothetical protein
LKALPCKVSPKTLSCTLVKNRLTIVVQCRAMRYSAVYPPSGPQPSYRCTIRLVHR